jgi:hypothetical protein
MLIWRDVCGLPVERTVPDSLALDAGLTLALAYTLKTTMGVVLPPA